MDDLIRLHYLVTSRKVTTILEIGVGKSTTVFDHALEQNKLKYGDFVNKNLRRSNAFECHSVDNNEEWIDLPQSYLHNTDSSDINIEIYSVFDDWIEIRYTTEPRNCQCDGNSLIDYWGGEYRIRVIWNP